MKWNNKKDGDFSGRWSRLIDELMIGNFWFRFPKHLLPLLSDPEAIFLAFLINESNMVRGIMRRKQKQWDGFFYCRITHVEKQLGYNLKKQCRIITKLRDRRFISYDRRGIPPKRFFRVNLKRILNACRERLETIDNDMDDVPFFDE